MDLDAALLAGVQQLTPPGGVDRGTSPPR